MSAHFRADEGACCCHFGSCYHSQVNTIQDLKHTHIKEVTQKIILLEVNDNRHKKNKCTSRKKTKIRT